MTSGGAKAMLILTALSLIGGFGGMVMGFQDFSAAKKMKADPRVIKAADLIRNGPGDNRFVRITDAELRVDAAVVRGGNAKTFWKTAYLPVDPADEETDPDGTTPRIVLVADQVTDKDKLKALAKSKEFQGVLGTWDDDLDDKSREFLTKNYPELKTKPAVVLKLGGTPRTAGGSIACMVIGAGLILLSATLVVLARRFRWGEHIRPAPITQFAPTAMFAPPMTMAVKPPSISTGAVPPPVPGLQQPPRDRSAPPPIP